MGIRRSGNKQPVSQSKGVKRRLPHLPKHWENFLLSLTFILILPLLPIIIEYWRSQVVEIDELLLTASMYAIGVGATSASRLMFVFTIIMGVCFAFAYGSVKGSQNALPLSDMLAYTSIGVIFIIHALERYNIHVVDMKSWEFPGDKS